MHFNCSRIFPGAVLLLCTLCLLLLTFMLSISTHASTPIHSNPYNGASGPPNCTWYAWQRLHDVEHLDLQFTANAGDWIERVQQPNAVWSEVTQSYIQPHITITPAPGDIAVLPYPNWMWARPSHVAFIERVLGSGTFEISQQSYRDFTPGTSTWPYPYVRHAIWHVGIIQQAEQGHARFIHFFGATSSSLSVDRATVVGQSASLTLQPHQHFTLYVIVLNISTTIWSDAGHYRLVCNSNCMGIYTIGLDGQRIPPNQQYRFILPLTAPATSGSYTTAWRIVHAASPFGPAISFTIAVRQHPAPRRTPAPWPSPTGVPTLPSSTPTPALTGVPTPTPTPVSLDQRYVTNLYHDILGRAATTAEINECLQALASGESRAQVASSILSSSEYRTELVNADYQLLLGRQADPTGLQSALGLLNRGVRNEDILYSLGGSNEFYARAGGTDSAFVSTLYQDLLQRSAAPSEIANWTQQLANGVSRATVAQGIVTSKEYYTRLVDDFYLHYLNRPADPSGQGNAVAILSQGGLDESVIADLVASNEYYDKP